MSSSDKFRFSVVILLIFHLVGWIGMNMSPYRSVFEQISWANMLISFGLVFLCHEPFSDFPGLMIFIVSVFILGISAEVAGVKTGLIFGTYHYTPLLGVGIMGVPLIIGLNWVMLSYAAGVSTSRLPLPIWAKFIAGALLMVMCDILLEGLAVKHHFWVWENSGLPPLRNYVGWFGISLLSNILFQKLIPDSRNRVVRYYLIIFILFLIADHIS